MKRMVSFLLALSLLAGGTAAAYDIQALADKNLPSRFTYKEIPGTEKLPFAGGEVPYRMGQLAVNLNSAKKFSSGYIVRTRVPARSTESMMPFFGMNMGEDQWKALSHLNRAFLDPESKIRKEMEKTMLRLAVNSIGPMAEKNVKVEISGEEPLRRLVGNEAYVLTAGARVIYDEEGLILPMYTRAYLFPSYDRKYLEILMLFTPDEGKGPLVYAIDDLAKAAAKEELLGEEGYKDLGEILGNSEKRKAELQTSGK